MRHWAPWIEEVVGAMIEDGITHAISLVLAPHYSKLSVAKYQSKIADGLEMYRGDIQYNHIASYHDAPLYIEALANRVEIGLSEWPEYERDDVHVVFSAHSLPVRILQMEDPYDSQLRETARLVAERAGLAENQWSVAGGALLLFGTNFLSILLAGGAVLALLGLNKAVVKGLEGHARRNAYLLVAVAVILVIIPLGTTTVSIFQQRQMEKETVQLAYRWITDTGYTIRRVQVYGDLVTLEIYGSGERPELSELGDQLNDLLDQPVNLRMFIVPSEEENYFAGSE